VWSMVIVVVHPLLVCRRAGVIGQVGVGVGGDNAEVVVW
jgi:hypothetical protein